MGRGQEPGLSGLRRAAALLATLLVCLAASMAALPAAVGDPVSPSARVDDSSDVPTRLQVDRARARAAQTAVDVSVIQTRLLLADQRRESAAVRAEEASEAYNGALWRLEQATAAYRAAQSDAARARRTVETQRGHLGVLVAQSYQNGGELSALQALVSADGPEGVLEEYAAFQGASSSLQADYQRFAATDSLARVFETKAREARAERARRVTAAEQARAGAAAAASSAQSEATQIASEKSSLLHQLARAQRISLTLARTRQHALEAIARERARHQAAALVEAQAREGARARAAAAAEQVDARSAVGDPVSSGASGSGAAGGGAVAGSGAARPSPAPDPPHQTQDSRPDQAQDPRPDPAEHPASAPEPTQEPVPDPAPVSAPGPSPSGGAQQAIGFARAQLGEPYRWGAAGPDSWDCSGLTMAAWASAGISLPHYSVAQYYAGTPISASDMRPGDLVFWSSNGSPEGIHHVAMYVGGGQVIHAPRTGRPVAVDSMYYWIPPSFFVRV